MSKTFASNCKKGKKNYQLYIEPGRFLHGHINLHLALKIISTWQLISNSTYRTCFKFAKETAPHPTTITQETCEFPDLYIMANDAVKTNP